LTHEKGLVARVAARSLYHEETITPNSRKGDLTIASIALGAHYEKFLKELVDEGRHNNDSEVVRAGLRMLEDHEAGRARWIREELPGRLAAHLADPSTGIPAEEVHAELRTLHERRKSGKR
jgi:antitoxin ParD1/3/4